MNSSYSITSKFQVTIPKEIRDELKLTDKDRVSFERRGKDIVVQKVPTMKEVAEQMAAKFKASGLKPATDEEIKNAPLEFFKKDTRW